MVGRRDRLPELPEVEVTRRKVRRRLVGRVVARVFTTSDSCFFATPRRRLERELVGRRFVDLTRRGKYLLATLDDGRRLLLHLGMTGQIFTSGAASVRLLAGTARAALRPEQQLGPFAPDIHTHLRITFRDGGPELLFRDTRKFGRVQLLAPGEASRRLERLGDDALGLSAGRLFESTRRRRVPIKALLLDQAVTAGVGNIYADEALFRAGIRPRRRARTLSRAEAARLAEAVRQVLRRAIRTGGSSISDYVQPDGSDGRFQDERRVYARTGEPCRACGAPIRRVVIAQRSSHYCPTCQR
jgi:formamidopyrimidine-DNA glycosylase